MVVALAAVASYSHSSAVSCSYQVIKEEEGNMIKYGTFDGKSQTESSILDYVQD